MTAAGHWGYEEEAERFFGYLSLVPNSLSGVDDLLDVLFGELVSRVFESVFFGHKFLLPQK